MSPIQYAIIAVVAIIIILGAIAVSAPEGYESEEGFRYGKDPRTIREQFEDECG